jgi:hypothetical protein
VPTFTLCATLLATLSGAAPARLRGVGVDETLAGPALLADALNEVRMRADGLPLYVRILVAPGDLDDPGGGPRFERLDERVGRYTLKGVPIILALTAPLPAPAASDGWRRFLEALGEHYRGRVKAYQLGELAGEGPAPDVHDYAYSLKLAAVQLRAADPEALIVQGALRPGDVAWEKAVCGEDVGAYLDAVALGGRREELEDAIPAMESLLAQESPRASLAIVGLPLSEDPESAVRDLLDWQLFHLGTKAALTTYRGTQAAAAAALPAVERLKDLLTADLVPLDDKSAGLTLSPPGGDRTGVPSHALLYNMDDLGTYLVYRGQEPGEATLGVELADSTGRKLTLRDPLKGRSEAVRSAVWDQKAAVARASVPLRDRPLILEFAYGEAAYLSHSEVNERVLPPVGEIVFRHQLAQTAQDALLRTYMANARMENHFRPSATDPGFDVVTENRFYSDKDGSEWEETAFSLNGTRWGSKRPPFPLLQPEKVLSLPLDLRLTKDYRYRLEGVEKVDEHECYAVRFEPLTASHSLYRGTVWIDTKTFVKVKVQAVQTHLGVPVVSNEEIQYFTPEASVEERPLYLLSRFTSRQIMLIAGRNMLVERMVRLSDFEVNAPSFTEKRATSRAGANIMYRDTDEGLRYYVKRGDKRVVEEHPTTSAKALAVGVIFDPSFDYPLPIVGVNYLNFNFLNKDTQLALLFGGILALGNIQRPKALGDKVDANLDLFAIAVPVNDEVFDSHGEVRSERLRDHPFSTGLNLGYQLTSFQKLIGSYQFRFDGYSRDSQTAPGFLTPASTLTNGFGLGYEYRRSGYSLIGNGFYYRRSFWRSWGTGASFSPDQGSYEKFSMSLSKDFFIQPFHKIHLNAAYYGGSRLDRFSMYQFGLFDENRIHGVPSNGVRFSDLSMFRGSYSFNLFDQYRLDLFVDQALGRERVFDDKWRSVTGLGVGFNLRFLFGTLLRGEIGKSFLPDRYRGSGSVVGQVMVLKPL